jgi:hypothetical protein
VLHRKYFRLAMDEGGVLIRDVGSYQKKYQVWPGDYGRRNTYQIGPRILNHQPERPYPAGRLAARGLVVKAESCR